MKQRTSNRLWALLLAVAMVAVLAACDTADKDDVAEGNFPAGTYEGTAKGFGGDVVATVVLSDTGIESIEVVGEAETPNIGTTAMEQLPLEMVAKQTAAVDAITGATITSEAVIAAVNAALVSAGVDPASLGSVGSDSPKGDETLDVDVVVVGAGGAGMTAAIVAKQAGLNVVIVEKTGMAGGNTTKATGGMNAAETKYQEAQGIEDTVATFVEDTLTGGYNIGDEELVTILAQSSSDAIDWLDSIGAPLPKVSFSGGASNARIHAPDDGSAVGPYLVAAFTAQLDTLGVPVYYNTTATEILVEDGTAVGILAEGKEANYTINAKVVVLATGGFGANEDMYTQYRPELKGFVTTNTPGATGDGIVMAEAAGADFVDLEQIQIHPTVEQTTSIMITEGVRGDGAILVNAKGERFTNEMGTRDVVSAAVIAEEGGYAYIIFDQNLRENLAATETYVKNGIVVEGETIEALAGELDMDPETLAGTLEAWNSAVASGDEAFGRTTGMDHDLSTAPYYAIKIAPGVHHTMGGVKINTRAQVVGTDGTIIPGLLAAGEVTGGIHGGNRLGGNAVADIVIFGRIAGTTAVELVEGA